LNALSFRLRLDGLTRLLLLNNFVEVRLDACQLLGFVGSLDFLDLRELVHNDGVSAHLDLQVAVSVIVSTLTDGQLDVGHLKSLARVARRLHDRLVEVRNDRVGSYFHHRAGLRHLERLYDSEARSLLDLLGVVVLFFVLITDGLLTLSYVLNLISIRVGWRHYNLNGILGRGNYLLLIFSLHAVRPLSTSLVLAGKRHIAVGQLESHLNVGHHLDVVVLLMLQLLLYGRRHDDR